MVLVMQTNIISEKVERTVVRVRFRRGKIRNLLEHAIAIPTLLPRLPLLDTLRPLPIANFLENVMLRDEMSRARMQGARQERAQQ